MLLFQGLEDCLADQVDIYIGANMFWYWEQGNPSARRAPDVMAIKGVGRAERRSFFSWLEGGAVPATIVEIVAEKTWREDLYEKRRLYAQLGVREYFLFDPEDAHLRPPLQGFRRDDQGTYIPIEPDTEERLKSDELNLYLRAEGAVIRLFDGSTGEPMLTREERVEKERQRAEAEKQRAEAEKQRADALEREVARLRSLLEQRGEKA
jgi:Uma2 family endonuclease